ncbi:MAG: hypothetical protein IJ783_03180, partial [Kiritimatiellae bacterium]|nr:hypothetical protein [Kiritimatiellia bacterium]
AVFARCFVPLLRRAADSAEDRSVRLVSGVCGAGALAGTAVAGCLLLNPVAEFAVENVLGVEPGSGTYAALDFLATGAIAACWLAFSFRLVWREWRGAPAVDPAASGTSCRWLLFLFACFVMMSFVLIALANPRGDVQDSFIQKVKFIASHGLWGMWIGYGFALALDLLRSRRRSGATRAVFAAACAAAALSPLVPIRENYFNFDLADKTSAADMDGHDFGWQFGNYQLRGAEAVSEELSPDEEPLPDPFFPPAMSQNAVFYGGTDPGRFVPTYMIYAAHVRPDVYLITQNALADPTYLDTMRGLYADSIWMPTGEDNQEAFSKYLEDVRAGRRPDLGGITVSAGGRIAVNGAFSVMEINAIIAERIFERNRDLHDFYVEESYAMEWMYPYLQPHGLIMKVGRDPAPISGATRVRDMDFWDWYCRRLLANPKFARELPARKNFGKLRASIAGLYAARRDWAAAERAYLQALSLYVYSPESVLRLAREIYLPARRFADSIRLLGQLAAIDPNNASVPKLIAEVTAMSGAADRVAALSPRLRMGDPLSADELAELAEAAARTGDKRAL